MSNKSLAIFVVVVIIAAVGIGIAVSMSYNNPATAAMETLSPSPTINVQQANESYNPASSTPVTPAATTVTVTYNGTSFSPSMLSIRIGDSVKFVNNSSGRMWVASDPHPQHTDLPGFDEKASASKGQSWTYIFTVAGAHGYHNHANPSATGTVTVQ